MLEPPPVSFFHESTGYAIGLAFLAIHELATFWIETAGEVGSFNVGPSQILVATFAIVASFFLFIGERLALHTPAVTGVVPRTGEALDLSGFQCDGESQNLPDPWNRL